MACTRSASTVPPSSPSAAEAAPTALLAGPRHRLRVFQSNEVDGSGFSGRVSFLRVTSAAESVAYDGRFPAVGLAFSLAPGKYLVTSWDREVFDDGTEGNDSTACAREVTVTPGATLSIVRHGPADACAWVDGEAPWTLSVTAPRAGSATDEPPKGWSVRLAESRPPSFTEKRIAWLGLPSAVTELYWRPLHRAKKEAPRDATFVVNVANIISWPAGRVVVCGLFEDCPEAAVRERCVANVGQSELQSAAVRRVVEGPTIGARDGVAGPEPPPCRVVESPARVSCGYMRRRPSLRGNTSGRRRQTRQACSAYTGTCSRSRPESSNKFVPTAPTAPTREPAPLDRDASVLQTAPVLRQKGARGTRMLHDPEHPDLRLVVAMNVAAFARQRRLTLRAVSRRSGLARSHLRRLLEADTSVSIDRLARVAWAVDAESAWLLEDMISGASVRPPPYIVT